MDNEQRGSAPTPEPGRPSQEDLELFKSARRLALVGGILGPVSLVFGGMLFDAIAIVCCAMALTRFRKISAIEGQQGHLAFVLPRMKRACIIIIVVASVAFVLNGYSAIVMYPIIEQALSSGDFSAILGAQSGGTSAGSGSVWG